MTNIGKQRILVAPLDWGIGHAARCAPLIDRWLNEGHEVILASNGRSAAWLQQRYPQLEVLTDIPDYAVTYPAGGNMSLHFAKHLLRLMRVVRAEHAWLKCLMASRSIDCVYSDNRYGLYHKQVPCIFITHQLYVRVPWWGKSLVYGLLNGYLRRFQSIWVPDVESDVSLSGALSHGGLWDMKVKYVGPLSRLASNSIQATNMTAECSQYQIVALISGPEPSRTAFENQLSQLLTELNRPALLVLGKPDEKRIEHKGNLTCMNHLADADLADALRHAQLVICRSGYSTIMDLHALGIQALLVPTPGQTEQEYLAQYHAQQGNHFRIEQKHLTTENLQRVLQLKVEG